MKILIDIDKLEKYGVVTSQLASVLRAHAVCDTGSTAINMLLAFGVILIAAGLLCFIPSLLFVAFLGAGFILLGWLVKKENVAQWGKLASIWMMTGALVLSGSVCAITNHPFISPLIVAVILAFVSVIAESRLLVALVPFAIAAAIGGSTGYWHACYAISIKEPTLTIVLFSVFAYASWQFARLQTGLYQSLAIVFVRMCIILVNFGFWVGSLWGDTPGKIWNEPNTMNYLRGANQQISDMVFIVSWAIVLVLAGVWGAKHGRRFMVNTVAVFGAIHFYTQWFERFGAHPGTVVIAGITTVAFGLGLWSYNKKVLCSSI